MMLISSSIKSMFLCLLAKLEIAPDTPKSYFRFSKVWIFILWSTSSSSLSNFSKITRSKGLFCSKFLRKSQFLIYKKRFILFIRF